MESLRIINSSAVARGLVGIGKIGNMSYKIGYFFNYPQDLAQTAKDINEWLGCSLAPYLGDTEDWFDIFLGMELSFRKVEGFENEGELDFENFRYEINFRTAMGGAGARPIQLPAITAVVYALYHRLGITGILVFDLQILIARYEERDIPDWDKGLYDVVSDNPFVGFGAHLKLLEQRMPDSWRIYIDR
ncbi:hypothetical protein [Nostoc sp.]|uniref:hypothetical protein n=1 Tax=Nostoc sp. TaxID=1180 RepID=UPI002FF23725